MFAFWHVGSNSTFKMQETVMFLLVCLLCMVTSVVILQRICSAIWKVLINIAQFFVCVMCIVLIMWLLSTCHALDLNFDEVICLLVLCYGSDLWCRYRMTQWSPFAFFCGCMLVVSICLVVNGLELNGNPVCSLSLTEYSTVWKRIFINVVLWSCIFIAFRKGVFWRLCKVLGVVVLTLTVCTTTVNDLVRYFIGLADTNVPAKYLLWYFIFVWVIYVARLFRTLLW